MQNAIKETKKHGKLNFPYEVYRCRIPEYFSYFPMHWHEEFEIVYILEGIMTVGVQSFRFDCKAGDIVIIPPEYIHELSQYQQEDCHYINIVFSLNLLESQESGIFTKYFKRYFENGFSMQLYVPKEHEVAKLITPYIISLFNGRHDVLTEELLVKSNLYGILFYIQKLFKEADTEHISMENLISRIKPILELIKKDSSREISVQDAADYVNLSPSHFMNVFKKVTGYSFTNYLKMSRLENAKAMLSGSDKNISEISDECGFRNLSYFIRSFKERYGFSPLQFKKTHSK